jgi:hypothetical protein
MDQTYRPTVLASAMTLVKPTKAAIGIVADADFG